MRSGDKKKKRDYFSYIRSKKAARDNIGPLLDGDENLASDDKGLATVLNQTFSKVFTEENDRVLHPIKIFHGSDSEMLSIKEIQVQEVRKYLRKIDPNKSTGPDNILP